ncbi:hypothetical protein [Candidatus Cytomitobacter primus]|uniref:Uncharacterized protein n=1 Tax=Candidatus Cytomitobacter primus TaxID=2066024 RepID=A0A5C0UEF9_9PROT|nr:hypothetical protein [Candidatus Cytomitobacter primus]QEK38476.1 hypothetical protein FZC34_00900 [Candidatus Cytomitobacter primus]
MYYTDFFNHIEFWQLVSLNIIICCGLVLASMRNYRTLKLLLSNKLNQKHLGIFQEYKAIIHSKELVLFNWIAMKKSLKSIWNMRISMLIILMLINPILVNRMRIDCFYNFLYIEISVLIALVFVAGKAKKFFCVLENNLRNSTKQTDYTKQEVQYLVNRLANAQQSFENGSKINIELKHELENIVKNIVYLSRINHTSKDLLEQLTKHLINKK